MTPAPHHIEGTRSIAFPPAIAARRTALEAAYTVEVTHAAREKSFGCAVLHAMTQLCEPPLTEAKIRAMNEALYRIRAFSEAIATPFARRLNTELANNILRMSTSYAQEIARKGPMQEMFIARAMRIANICQLRFGTTSHAEQQAAFAELTTEQMH